MTKVGNSETGVTVGTEGPRPEHGAGGSGTRRQILAVAIELFASQGYAGTSIRDITDRMGLTKASLYYHFSSKEAILEAVTEPLRTDFAALGALAAQVPTPPAGELLARMVDVLSRRIALIRTVMADPSAHVKHRRSPEVQVHVERITAALAVDGTPGALLRARCALGAVQVAAFATARGRAGPHPDELRTDAMLAGTEHLLDAGERADIVAAALRALG